MFLISSILDRFYRTRLKNRETRQKFYHKALRKELRTSKLGQIALRNLNELMAENPEWHEEFQQSLKGQDYQAAFWESDLGYLWYQGNLNAQNAYFKLALERIKTKHYASVLDVGCGWGEFIAKASTMPEVENTLGIDISADIVDKARQLHPKVRFEHKDLMDVQGHFDLLTFFGSTDYIHPSVFSQTLEKAISIADKEILLVNSLRKIPFENARHLKESLGVKRYDSGYVHPLSFILDHLQKQHSFTYTVEKAGLDSALVTILKK